MTLSKIFVMKVMVVVQPYACKIRAQEVHLVDTCLEALERIRIPSFLMSLSML